MTDAIAFMESTMSKEDIELVNKMVQQELVKVRRILQKEAQAKQPKRRALHV